MSRKELCYILFWSLFSFIWITFCAGNIIGLILSVLMFLLLIWFGIFKKERLLEVLLLIMFLIPEYPRDILFLYDALDSKEIFYNTINTVKIGPLTLFYWAIIVLPILVITINKFRINLASGIAAYLVITVIVYLLVITQFSSQSFNLSRAITNIKIYIALLSVFLLLSNWNKQKLRDVLQSFLVFLPAIIGLRVILFILYDFSIGTPSWDYFTQPLITVVTFILLLQSTSITIFERSFLYRILFYISLFTLSRAVIGIVLVSFIFVMFLSKKRMLKIKVLFEVIPFLAILCFTVFLTNPNLYNFLIWKVSDLNVFEENKELSGSGKVRQYEIINIVDGKDSNALTMLTGFGLSGSFNFDKHPLPIVEELDSKSFSENERIENKFYFPHSFIAANLLRGGLILTLVYIFTHLALAIHFFRKKEFYFSLLSIYLIYNSYVRIEYALLLAILILLALNKSQGRLNNYGLIRQRPND